MITVTNNNCHSGITTMTFDGYQAEYHLATYLTARSGNEKFDMPYLGDYEQAVEWVKELRVRKLAKVNLCMGDKEYETLWIKVTEELK